MTAVRELPSPVKRSKIVSLILESPPPMPACWRSVSEWQDWLMLTHTAGEPITKRVFIQSRGVRTIKTIFADIDYCVDCPAMHQAQMQAANRCFPANVPTKESA